MAALFLETAIRALLIAFSTAALLWALRIKTAATRHAAWTAVVIAMLLLPIWSMSGFRLPVRVLRPAPAETVTTPIQSNELTEFIATAPPAAPQSAPAQPFDWQRALVGAYLFGALLLLTRLAVGTAHANRLRRAAIAERGRATSDLCTTPITVGFLRPTLILPATWPRWPSAQLNAVLTHEGEHVRRHDPLVQWIALVNRAVFWFHPLSWWLERRLATLAEEACDAAVLAAGHSPQDYSEYLLEMARAVTRDGRRVRVVGMAMPGHGLAPRLRQILDGVASPPVSRSRAAWTVALCATSSAIFAAGTLDRMAMPISQHAAPAFEVASIKINKSGDLRSPSMIQPGGRFTATNNTLRDLVLNAYDIGTLPDLLQGGPGWIDSERFDIDAKAAAGAIPNGTPDTVLWQQTRLMLRRLLEDRFKLAVRRESKVMPVYRLTALAKRPTLQKSSLDCTNNSTPCHGFSGNPLRLTGMGVDMADVARALTFRLGRPVIDDTGIEGIFDVTLQWNPWAGRDMPVDASASAVAPSREGARPDASSLPDVSTALQLQLGIKLNEAKSPVDVYVIDRIEHLVPDDAFPSVGSQSPAVPAKTPLVIDHVERPTPNGPSAVGPRR